MIAVPAKEPGKDKIFPWLNPLIFFLIIINLLLILWKRNLYPEQIPLYYSRPWGEEQLAPNKYLFLLPIFSLAVFLFNFQIFRILLKKEEIFFAWVSGGISLLFSILSTVTLWQIIFLIT